MRAEVSATHDDRTEVVFRLEPGDPARTSQVPALVMAVREALPGLDRHSCTSPSSGLLASELPDTELAHLFEHVTLELMVLSGSPRTLTGSTDWDFSRDGTGVFRVTVGHDDPQVAAGAACEALSLLQSALAGCPMPDPAEAVARLTRLRRPAE